MRKSALLLSLLATMLVACGSDSGTSSDDAFGPPAGGGGGGSSAAVASLSLVTSSPTLPSDGATSVEITAFVRNASNQFMANVPVTFTSNSGGLLVTQGTTDSSGIAKATLSAAGDPSNRAIVVTAMAGSATDTVNVGVTGTTLSIQGPNSLTQNQQGTYTVTLLDAGNHGIPNRPVTITSARSNTLNPASLTTDSNGRANFNMTATNSASDTLTATGLGVTSTLAVAVNSDSFTFTAPAANTEVALGASQAVTVRWTSGGAPVVGRTVNLSTTRGTLSAATGVTDGTGSVTVNASSTNAGPAIVTAQGMNAAGTAVAATTQLTIEFVATTAASIDVQPSQFTVQTGGSSTITAVVRDAAGNLVKNKTVVFTLNDVSGGSLSIGSGVTDSQGRAQTVYTASNTTSANNGVQITATVSGTAVTKTVALTVAGRQVFISLGTGNEVAEPNSAQYRVDYVVQVTDSNGNGVSGVPVSLRILSMNYYKGYRSVATPPLTGWGTTYTAGPCIDEDSLVPSTARNGTLDPGEDFNANGRIEAGNIASVTPSNGVTDVSGFLLVSVFYPQEYAYYLDVALSASATVQGTEYVRTSSFMVPGTASDFSSTQNGAPGSVSPFGMAGSCANPN